MRIRFFIGVIVLVIGLGAASAQETPPPGVTIHVVQRGETLFDIARSHGLTIQALADLNNIANPNSIFVGQRLLVPSGDLVAISPNAVLQPTPTPIFHIVRGGETLFRIAQRYGLTVNALASANNITDPSLIYSGQRLVIPSPEAAVVEPAGTPLPSPLNSIEIYPRRIQDGQSVRFTITAAAPITVTGTFLDRAFVASVENGGSTAIVLAGVPVGTVSGEYTLQLNVASSLGQERLELPVRVEGKAYRREFINVLGDRTNLLDPAADEAELNILRTVMSAFNPERYFGGLMGLPAAAGISSPFGSTRTYAGSDLQRIHTGTDFAGAPGSPIIAPASGRVVLADTLNIRGVATVIDHGWGIYTGYWHQSERYVSVGDFVTTGRVIGAIGSTGRVTGAHLHWELWVNGVPVDPMQWVGTVFAG
jgi:murein DD-endopeptidase MepM/ murein hydrolase activator NlpD